MDLQAYVKYNEGEACFRVLKEEPGLYFAELLYFEGEPANKPPEEITLVRGIRCWAGSHDNKDLLTELGKQIEAFYTND